GRSQRRVTVGHETSGCSEPSSSSTSPGGLTYVQHPGACHQPPWSVHLEKAARATRLPEPRTLFTTLSRWRRELLTFCRTRTTNARTEAANLTAKTFKRVGRGYRNHDNYRCRIMAYTTSPKAA